MAGFYLRWVIRACRRSVAHLFGRAFSFRYPRRMERIAGLGEQRLSGLIVALPCASCANYVRRGKSGSPVGATYTFSHQTNRRRRLTIKSNEALLQRGLWLEYATLGWNVVGVFFILTAALRAHSVALAGFGLDSAIEIGASLTVVWQLKGIEKNREKPALRLIGASFFGLAIYLALQSLWSLATHQRAQASPFGVLWLALTCIVMLLLAWGKARTGAQLNNIVLQTEARVTVIDALLALCVLVGLMLNAQFGWWQADSLVALVIVFYGVKEGLHAWREAKRKAFRS